MSKYVLKGDVILTVFVCVDDDLGMTFCGRRQSRDSAVTDDMIKEAVRASGKLYALPFSEKLIGADPRVEIKADALKALGRGDYVFVENEALLPYLKKISRLVIYHWNRAYPSDKKLDTPPKEHGFRLFLRSEIKGTSHDRITKEVYLK